MLIDHITLSKIRSYLIILGSFLIFTSPTLKANNGKKDQIVVFSKDSVFPISSFELKKAERLYYGLITTTKGSPSCAECHYLQYSDTLNWNPSGFDIAATFAGRPIEDLTRVLNNPSGKKLQEVHAGYDITKKQAVLLQAYLEKLSSVHGPEKNPLVNNLLLFILVNILGLAFTIDLLFTHKIPFRAIHLIVIIGAAVFILRTLVVEGINVGRQQDYAPQQPIKFSHKIHAGQNQIDCQYCHYMAEESKSAGIPSSDLCMNCHQIVTEGPNSGRFEIRKISEALENMTPVEWVRIHNLPDHVFFSHAQHVGVGKLDCQECHGPVDEMDVVYQFSDLSMGWCLECHRTRGVDFIDNAYYETFEEYHEKIAEGEIDSVLVTDIGGTNCMKCHY